MSRSLAVTAAILLAALLVNLRWATPLYNWDLIPYLGVAERFAGASPEVAHQRAYRSVREAVPEARWELLVGGNEYRRVVAADPVAFDQQLPFYSVKPAYPLLILGLQRAGMSPVRASVVVSQVAYLGVGLVLLIWFAAFLRPIAAGVSAWAAMSLQFVLVLARISTPDALSTLVVVTALWLLVERGRPAVAMAVLIASVTVRPDNQLWVVSGGLYVALRRREDRRWAAVSVAAGLGLYFALARGSGNLGWATLFHHHFVERLSYPASFEPSLSLFQYVWIYLRESHPANLPPFVMLYGVLGAWLLASRVSRAGWRDRWVIFLGSTGFFSASHWLVHPDQDRLFAPLYLTLTLVLIRFLSVRYQDPDDAPSPAVAGGIG